MGLLEFGREVVGGATGLLLWVHPIKVNKINIMIVVYRTPNRHYFNTLSVTQYNKAKKPYPVFLFSIGWRYTRKTKSKAFDNFMGNISLSKSTVKAVVYQFPVSGLST